MEKGKLLTAEERAARKHEYYLKAKAAGKPWALGSRSPNYVRPAEWSAEERERRRLASAAWRAEHPGANRESIRAWRALHHEEERKSDQEYRRNNKRLAIDYLGGHCAECGKNYHPEVYDFHHINGDEKDACIGKLLTHKFEKIKPELDKCILVCANCHRMIHAQY